ncbi:MAG: hypothetical protein UY21_C0007G0025 [Microgenomates group bacterium GW2011_GWA1_48_10]|uniref:Dockerin domain-containing protein n=1 Tax=Candidatus Gottesmanbacteria bacterium RIFCSPHIGHO2_01_FULL_47_48 TaxID=1798381 RepID=A0A1F6A2T1_9BACT|nr:MAG: hypothetical protein UY21_C0007G0025 [Microgenomates group bacterium GW2011_GWA1_48_10]OGG18970.1 MAG: hypothetical protein A2721_02415 [Candidatus Gottesmanbacteria bacterium RIFCSPHIGHO2_01_FULL_47_48]
MRRILLPFLFGFIIFLLFSGGQIQAVAYQARERFGSGGTGWGVANISNKDWQNFWKEYGVGWYVDWSYKFTPPAQAAFLASVNKERLTLVGKSKNDRYSAANCQALKNTVAANPEAFGVAKTLWSVGNELGYDDPGMTATLYATQFISWRDCIKSINPNYKVGSGAIISPYTRHPRAYGPDSGCVASLSDPASGESYFRTYINRIRALNGAKLPDFIVMHGYFWCMPTPTGVSNPQLSRFINQINLYRAEMKQLGLQGKDLIIKEFFDTSSGGYPGGRVGFMTDAVNFLMNARDTNLGNPGDDFHLVQRFAWFNLINDLAGATYTQTLRSNNFASWTALGNNYQSLIKKYAGVLPPPAACQTAVWQNGSCGGSCPVGKRQQIRTVSPAGCASASRCVSDATCSVPPAGKSGDANGDGLVDQKDYEIWLGSYGKSVSSGLTQGDFNADGKVDGRDYVVWFNGYGK